jgi:hypothetical protein
MGDGRLPILLLPGAAGLPAQAIDHISQGVKIMKKNGFIGALVVIIFILVAAFLMRGPSQPAGSGSSQIPAPSNSPPPAVSSPSPPATAPTQ